MKRWKIENVKSGLDLGTWLGESESAALREMYKAAGYEDPKEIPGGFWPEEIKVIEITQPKEDK